MLDEQCRHGLTLGTCVICTRDDRPSVYITAGGTRYHPRRDCPALRHGQEAVIRRHGETAPIEVVRPGSARLEGCRPCLTCRPAPLDYAPRTRARWSLCQQKGTARGSARCAPAAGVRPIHGAGPAAVDLPTLVTRPRLDRREKGSRWAWRSPEGEPRPTELDAAAASIAPGLDPPAIVIRRIAPPAPEGP